MAEIVDILEQDAAETFALNQLGYFLNEVVPNRELISDSSNSTAPSTDFIVMDVISSTDYSGGMGNKPLHYEIAENGDETYIYKDKITLDLYAYIGKANRDLKLVRKMLGNKFLKFKHFGFSKGLVGVTDIGNILDSNVTVYETQEVRAGARLRLGITYIYKDTYSYGEYIDKINFLAITNSGDDQEIKEGTVE